MPKSVIMINGLGIVHRGQIQWLASLSGGVIVGRVIIFSGDYLGFGVALAQKADRPHTLILRSQSGELPVSVVKRSA